jgi:signal transduction histidine kinase
LRRRFFIALVVCTALGLLDFAHNAYWLRVSGRPFTPMRIFLREATPWIVWAFFVPVVTRWGERFQLDWPPEIETVLAHVMGIASTTVLLAFVRTILERNLNVPPPTQDFLPYFGDTLIYSIGQAVITYCGTIGLGYAASYSARSRELLELQSELSKAQLSALRMQLNPHFFFNTLHTIGALVRDENNRGAIEMIEKLGDVLHRVLRTDAELDGPLRDEVEFLRQYLEIEQVRFGDRLKVSWQLDPKSESLSVPKLLLQPLVENALRHGLSRRARPGSLTIKTSVQGDRLELVVADDGVGLPPNFDLEAGRGVGLANVRARLSRMYGAAAEFSIRAGEDGGATARIVLPLFAEPRIGEAHE